MLYDKLWPKKAGLHPRFFYTTPAALNAKKILSTVKWHRIGMDTKYLLEKDFHRAMRETMAHVITIISPIHAAGKTITAINLAAALAVYEKKTLLIDCDPRNNCIYGTVVEPPPFDFALDAVLTDEARIRDTLFETPLPKLKCIPAGKHLAGAGQAISQTSDGISKLAEKLKVLSDDFEFIVINTPTGLGPLAQIAIAASDELLIPLHSGRLESGTRTDTVDRVQQFLMELENVRIIHNGLLIRKNILLTKCDEQLPVTASAIDAFRDHVIFPTIPYDERLRDAYVFGKPIVRYDVTSRGAAAYLALAKEVIQQVKKDIDLLMDAPKEPAVKLTDSEIIDTGEHQLIQLLISHLDMAALKSAVQKESGPDAPPDIVFESGDIVIYDEEIAYQINFNKGFSVIMNRQGEQLALFSPITAADTKTPAEIRADSGPDKAKLREKAAHLAVELADMISEINR